VIEDNFTDFLAGIVLKSSQLRTVLPISWQVLSSRAVIEDSFTDFMAGFVLKSSH
jgi:hypothetical protein